jgi:cellulose synthase/poly-beta-1,6-N-acetylglucosamine synthase-like glycosyltransferase
MPTARLTRRLVGRVLLGLPYPSRSGRLTAPSSQRFGVWWTRHPRLLHAFALVALGWTAVYLGWRIGFSAAGAEPVLWGALLLAELYGLWNLATLAWMTWEVDARDAHGDPSADPAAAAKSLSSAELTVDVYICTYDEPLHVLEATLAGCALLDRAHTTYVLDDGRREEVRELAAAWDATWITRPDKSHAKAGNINHALPMTDGDLVLVLDADHVPMPDALSILCEPFGDPAVALVQSPHDFSNHDSIQHYALGRHEQSLFFSVICRGKDRHGAAFWCGSGAVIRRDALLQAGGVATETIAEDFHTTIKLHRAGWKSRYEPRTVVQGLAPHDLASYLLQRDRWARGNLAVFTTPESPLRARGLSRAQRMSYFASLTGYLAGPVRLLLLAVLIAVLWSAALPLRVAPVALATLWAPATLLSILAGTALCRGVQSAAETSHFELCTAEIFTRALRCALRPGRASFRVTPKEGVDPGGWQSLRQFRAVLVIAVLLGAGIVLRVLQDFGAGFLPSMPGFAAWFVPLLGTLELRRVLRTLAVAGRRRQLRTEYRTPLETSAFVEPRGTMTPPRDVLAPEPAGTPLLAKVHDITHSGLGFELATPLDRESMMRLSLRLPEVDGERASTISFEAQVRSCRQTSSGWRIGAAITHADEDVRRRIVEYCHVVWPYLRLRGIVDQIPLAAPTTAPLAVSEVSLEAVPLEAVPA